MNRKLLEKPLAFVQRFRTQSTDSGLATEKAGYLEQLRAEQAAQSGGKRHLSGPSKSTGSSKEADPSIWYVNTDSNSSNPIPPENQLMSSTTETENHGTTANEKPAKSRIKPKGTIDYEVKLSDTLSSIAIQFDTTPSELIKLNKLVMRTVFPSQILYVPDGSIYLSEEENSTSPPSISPPEKPKFDVPLVKMVDKPVKFPGHVERRSPPPVDPVPPHKLSEVEVEVIDKECLERFIKINVKHITDGQGVVNGTLLVTPNAVMFDPNVSDPLVIEHGAEKYGMITPMDMVMSAAMYHDIAAMKLRGHKGTDGSTCKPEIYHSNDCPLFLHKHHLGDSPDHPHNELCTDLDSMRPSRSTTVDSLRSEVESLCSCGALSRDVSLHDSITNPTESSALQQEFHDHSLHNSENITQTVDNLTDKISGLSVSEKIEICDERGDDIVSNVLDYTSSFQTDSIEQSDDTSKCQIDSQSGNSATYENKGDDIVSNVLDYASSFQIDSIEQSGNTSKSQIDSQSGNSAGQQEPAKSGDIISKPEPVDKDSIDSELIKSQSSQVEDPTRHLSQALSEVKVDRNQSESKIGNISYFPIEKTAEGNLIVRGGKGSQETKLPKRLKVNTDILTEEIPEAQFSPLKVSAQHLNNFVNYATGLFRSSTEDQAVKDVHDMKKQVLEELASKPMTNANKQLEVENAIKLEDKPSLFQTLDKLIPKQSIVCEDPPLYLCLRVGQPKFKEVSQTCPIESYRGNKKKPEYWFSIPREKVDQLYAFFVQWTPDIYGDEDEMDPEQRGFVVFDEDDLDIEENLEIVDEHFASIQKIRKNWEIISKVEAIRRLSSVDVEEYLPPPELIGDTTILTSDDMLQQLSNTLPPRTIGYPWSLAYSSELHGFSLKTLYRNMQGLDSPILLVVSDTKEHVFGAVVNCPPKISDHFYGTGESFLYTFHPDFKIFHWSGENNFFIKGNKESLSIGAGQGCFGLWFDGDLYHGRSQRCDTFDNDILTESEDFCVKAIEAWAFV